MPVTPMSPSEPPARTARPVRVMVVEDSRVIREVLTNAISQDPRLEIAAVFESGEGALAALREVSPDVISMDIRLPGMDGLETIRRVMAERPTPIVVVAADVESEDLKISINALRAGALSVLEKQTGCTPAVLDEFGSRLCTQLLIMSRVRVITQRTCGPGRPACSPATGGASPLRAGAPDAPGAVGGLASVSGAGLTTACGVLGSGERESRFGPVVQRAGAERGVVEMVGIVASTGGPNALVHVLGALGPRFPLPVMLVQHITGAFSRAFIDWLGGVCEMRVVEGVDGARPAAGTVHVAPADAHLVIRGRRIRLEHGPAVCSQRPSGTVMLSSMARELGSRAVGVVLTGMGNDGARGLRDIRGAGGYTLAEHESTAVVYGMPGAAEAMGGVCELLPLGRIGPRLWGLAGVKGVDGDG